jgi:hypothetical protein
MLGRSGRGPTRFMSPRSTLNSCGSSSRRDWRRKRPTGVTRSSLRRAHTAWPSASASTRIDRNLKMVKGAPPRFSARRPPTVLARPQRRSTPTRVWA